MSGTGAHVWKTVSTIERADLDGQVVLYDPTRQQAHLLNTTATAILACIDGIADTTEITRTLSHLFHLPAAHIEADVARTVEQLADRRLIHRADAEPPAAEETGPDAAMAMGEHHGVVPVLATTSDRPTGPWTFTSPTFAALDLRFAILTNDHELGLYLTGVLTDLIVPEPPHLWYAVERQPPTDAAAASPGTDSYDLRLGSGSPSLSARSLSAVIGRLLWDYNHRAITTATAPLLLHASAASTAAGAVICPAPADSGKSTLITALVQHGFGYLTDECAAIDARTMSVRCYPKPIGLDPGAWPLFPDLVVADRRQPTKAWLPASTLTARPDQPPTRSPRTAPRPVPGTVIPIAAIVFNHYSSGGGATRAERLAPADVVARLARNTFRLAERPREGLGFLAEIAASVPAYDLPVDDLGVACSAIDALLLADR